MDLEQRGVGGQVVQPDRNPETLALSPLQQLVNTGNYLSAYLVISGMDAAFLFLLIVVSLICTTGLYTFHRKNSFSCTSSVVLKKQIK